MRKVKPNLKSNLWWLRGENENVRKMILAFLISALPLEVTFQMSLHFLHYGSFVKKVVFRFLKDGITTEIWNKMYKRGLFWAS